MRNKKVIICSLALVLVLCVSPVLASAPNPAQMGDSGGALAKQIEQQIMNSTTHPANNNKSAPVSSAPVQAYPVGGDSYPQGGQQGQQGVIMYTEPGTSSEGPMLDEYGNPIIVTGEGEGELQTAETLPGTVAPSDSATQSLDWFGIGFDLINKNKNITVYDVKTGITWGATYINGKNHADIIPSSAADASKLDANKITGDYVRRPVVVTISGMKFAGSMYAEGHGSTSYCNYFKGVMCIHFSGSMTHGTQKVDKDHQAAIQEALKH